MSEKDEIFLEIMEEFEAETDISKEKNEVEESIYFYKDSRFYRKNKPDFVLW